MVFQFYCEFTLYFQGKTEIPQNTGRNTYVFFSLSEKKVTETSEVSVTSVVDLLSNF